MSQHFSEDYLLQIHVDPEEDDFEDIDGDVINNINKKKKFVLRVILKEYKEKNRKRIKRTLKERNNTVRIKLVRKSQRLMRKVIKKNIKRHSKQVCRCNYRRCLGKGWRRPFENGPSCRLRKISMYKQRIKIGKKTMLLHTKNNSLEPVLRQYSDVCCHCNNSHCMGTHWPGSGAGVTSGHRYYYKK